MKTIALFVSIAVLSLLADLGSIRKQYIAAATSEKEADELYAQLEKVDDDSNDFTMVAYKAAALTLKAKYAKGLLNKKNLFTEGATLLEATVDKAPTNYEARLIRLNIQENAPRITGYNKKIKEDKAFLIKNYDSQPAGLKEFTKNFVKLSSSFTKEEKAAF